MIPLVNSRRQRLANQISLVMLTTGKSSPRGSGESEVQRADHRGGSTGGGRREAQPPAKDAQHRAEAARALLRSAQPQPAPSGGRQ